MPTSVQFGVLILGLLLASFGFSLYVVQKGKDSTHIEAGLRTAFVRVSFTQGGTLYVQLASAIVLAMVLR